MPKAIIFSVQVFKVEDNAIYLPWISKGVLLVGTIYINLFS